MQKIIDFFKADTGSTLTEFLKTLILTVIAVVICVAIVNAIFRGIKRRAEKTSKSTAGYDVFRYIILAVIYAAAIYGVLSTLPAFSTFMKTVLAGSGVAAIILSVAAQEPIGNLVSGLLIIFTKPFQAGDIIRYLDQDISGVVEEITLRHTVIRTFENKRLIIPNNTFNSCAIENSNYTDKKICLLLDFDITYESDAVLAMQIISDVVVMHPDFCDVRTAQDITNGVPPVKTAVMRFDSSSVVIRAWVWAASTDISVMMKSDILLSIQLRFEEAGIEFAYPHMTVINENK